MNLRIFGLFAFLYFSSLLLIESARSSPTWQSIETRILRNYERKHRPVKKESTQTIVKVIMMVNHIEEIVSFLGFLDLYSTTFFH
jgi:hypothetical protein